MSPTMQKKFDIDNTIQKREVDYRVELERRADAEKQMRVALSEDRQRSLEYQIQEKNNLKK